MGLAKRRASAFGLIILVLALLAGCGASSAQQTGAGGNGKLPVVATFSVLGDLVQHVGGDAVTVTTLVGPGGDAHTFEPTPRESTALVDATVVFENGLGFEPWLDDLYAASGSKAARVVVTKNVKTRTAAEEGLHDQHADEADPHVWHDVANTIEMVQTIAEGLASADPAHADAYRANAETYTAELRALDAFIVQQVNSIPAGRRKLVTSHDTFGYFAARYGFELVGTALGSASTEVADPSAAQVAALVQSIKAAGVPAIFAENVSNQQLIDTIANEAGVKVAPPLYTDALGEPGSAGATYIDMMRYNVSTIVTALGT